MPGAYEPRCPARSGSPEASRGLREVTETGQRASGGLCVNDDGFDPNPQSLVQASTMLRE